LTRIDDFVTDGGVGLKLTIQRATPIKFDLYGKVVEARTQSKTVEGLLKEKGVVLGAQDGVNVPLQTPISANMAVQVWRNGVQTVTEEQEVAFLVKQIRDTNRPIGFKEVQTPGVKGKRVVTYQVDMRNGVAVSRTEIQGVTIEQPKEQVEVVGAKPGNGLSKAKGVNMFVDSKGVTHRETYYDLNMSSVMRNCGAGGTYSVRDDGAKVDKDGYIIIAANLSRYPRCSVVETSLGLGKVYDTGGFTAVHPDGYDLATDWSNNDGR
ncbi:MAG TPA: G5 domain-containing protein, partial [Candidatus Saccharimonadales bacterium]|nr:G5 domain-containing protein [Candidatus Saccharimonadales bacterium]